MNENQLAGLREAFISYCRTFTGAVKEGSKSASEHFELKIKHTFNVINNITAIASQLAIDGNRLMIAEAVALFHDIGRFPQYAKYHTFRDSVSENHGLLGAAVLAEKGMLATLPNAEQEIIIKAVKFHNAFSVPERLNADEELYLKLVRDADKLDIWRIFSEYYSGIHGPIPPSVGLELKDTPGYSAEVMDVFKRKGLVPIAVLKNLNDFKIAQLAWVYDLNFSGSFKILLEKGIIGSILFSLPQTEEIVTACKELELLAKRRAFGEA